MSEHSPVVSLGGVTDHLDLLVTVEVGESSPGCWSFAPARDVGGVDSLAEASVSKGPSVPVSTEVVRAGLVSSSISVEVSILDVGSRMSTPMITKLVCSGVLLDNEVVVKFFFLLNFIGSNDGGDQSKL